MTIFGFSCSRTRADPGNPNNSRSPAPHATSLKRSVISCKAASSQDFSVVPYFRIAFQIDDRMAEKCSKSFEPSVPDVATEDSDGITRTSRKAVASM